MCIMLASIQLAVRQSYRVLCFMSIPVHADISAKCGGLKVGEKEFGGITAGVFAAGLLIGGITVFLFLMIVRKCAFM